MEKILPTLRGCFKPLNGLKALPFAAVFPLGLNAGVICVDRDNHTTMQNGSKETI